MVFLNENSKLKKKIKADAIITNQKKLPIAVLTADCVPVLLYDYEKKIIAAIHAGWKGAYRGIIKNVINFMHKKGCNPKNIIGKKIKNIYLVHQVHSNKLVFLNGNSKLKKRIKADAIITDQKKLPIAILTADCAPVLLYDYKRKIIAAIHAGWKGAYLSLIHI